MKRSALALFLAIITASLSGQNLIDIYKKGAVRLTPDAEYAKDNDWNRVFRSWTDTMYGSSVGTRKSVGVMPDGSVIVNHRYRNYFTRFSPSGKFEKEVAVTGRNGSPFKQVNEIWGVLDNSKFFTEPDNSGNMYLFDFNGNNVETVKLDYMARQIIALPGNRIAVVGWVIGTKKIRDMVAIMDLSTKKEKIVWDHYSDRSDATDHATLFHYSYTFKDGKSFSFASMPYLDNNGLASPPQLACVSGNLVISLPSTGEILTFSPAGEPVSKSRIPWGQGSISVEEQKAIQQKAIDNYRKNKSYLNAGWASPEEMKEAYNSVLRQMESDLVKIKDPIPVPVFSTILKDSDGNLLYFEYPKEEHKNAFNVWVCENNGKFVCRSSFVCDDYDLIINPSRMVFYKGSIYSLQVKKGVPGVPLRLVKFRIGN
jgi:hypothetical protein